MSLELIEQAIEKVALFNAGLGSRVARMATSTPHLKDVAIKAGVGAGVGGAANVVAGNSEDGIGKRFIKGAAGGAAAGGLYGAGKHVFNANKSLGRAAARPAWSSKLPEGHRALPRVKNPLTGV
jgi:hypothetical protein